MCIVRNKPSIKLYFRRYVYYALFTFIRLWCLIRHKRGILYNSMYVWGDFLCRMNFLSNKCILFLFFVFIDRILKDKFKIEKPKSTKKRVSTTLPKPRGDFCAHDGHRTTATHCFVYYTHIICHHRSLYIYIYIYKVF